MNDFASEPNEGATSSLLAQKSQLERVSPLVSQDSSKILDDEVDVGSL
jgi:hypothetical protein